jgi:hypothetical protein
MGCGFPTVCGVVAGLSASPITQRTGNRWKPLVSLAGRASCSLFVRLCVSEEVALLLTHELDWLGDGLTPFMRPGPRRGRDFAAIIKNKLARTPIGERAGIAEITACYCSDLPFSPGAFRSNALILLPIWMTLLVPGSTVNRALRSFCRR